MENNTVKEVSEIIKKYVDMGYVYLTMRNRKNMKSDYDCDKEIKKEFNLNNKNLRLYHVYTMGDYMLYFSCLIN